VNPSIRKFKSSPDHAHPMLEYKPRAAFGGLLKQHHANRL
jgi:hypothetical protein